MRTTRPKTLKGKVAAAVFTGLLTVGAASPAFATTENVGGGVWFYTVSVCCNVSEYDHNSVNHGSSVKNGDHGTVRSACLGPGPTARAEQTAAVSGNQAFWRHC